MRWSCTFHQSRRHQLQLVLAGLLALLLLLDFPAALWAHPLGNFTVNRYSRLELDAQQVHLIYVLDIAEIPTYQERAQMDRDGNGELSRTEQDQYLTRQVALLQSNAHLTLAGVPVVWKAEGRQLEFPVGQANLPTMRLTAHFVAALPATNSPRQAEYHDDNFADRIGWREVVVRALTGVMLLQSTTSAKDLSNELRNYPLDLLQHPADVTSARFTFKTQPAAGQREAAHTSPVKGAVAPGNSSVALRQAAGPFADRVAIPRLGPWAVLLALLAAFGYGAAHALTPGHGKTIVGAYLVGARGTIRHAVFLGLTTTITHTAGIFALGLLMWFVSGFVMPEKIFPWMSLLSGLLVVVLGLALAWRGFRHGQADEPAHRHTPAPQPGQADHAHHAVHSHGFGHRPGHTHLPADPDGAQLSWRSLLVLGVSGGLVPCPDALVGMLGAIALQRVGFGLVMLLAYSLGLASVLTLIGVLLVHSGKLFARIPDSGRVLRFMPVASALFMTVVGLGISWQALLQTGF